MSCMMRGRTGRGSGYTLIELLVVVAIIGIIAAVLVPDFLESLQKAKQKRTMADQRTAGTAMMGWVTDEAGAAAAGATVDMTSWGGTGWASSYDDVVDVLTPLYVQELPKVDGWKFGLCYALNTGSPSALNTVAVWSGGRRPKTDPGLGQPCNAWPSTVMPATSGPYSATDYENDILWADGTFIVWPERLD